MNRKQKIIRVAIGVLVGALITGGTTVGVSKYRQMQQEVATLRQKSATPVSNADNDKTLASVRSLVELPTDDNPTIATVSDAAKIKDQPFFASSQNGDRVLVFPKLKKAILYRPSTNKIVDIAPININAATNSGQVAGVSTSTAPTSSLKASPTASPTPKPQALRVYLLNGTSVAGLASKFETKLRTELSDATITKESATKTDYTTSTIVSLTDAGKAAATALADTFDLTPSTNVPEGQSVPAKTDIVIIIGQDKAATQ